MWCWKLWMNVWNWKLFKWSVVEKEMWLMVCDSRLFLLELFKRMRVLRIDIEISFENWKGVQLMSPNVNSLSPLYKLNPFHYCSFIFMTVIKLYSFYFILFNFLSSRSFFLIHEQTKLLNLIPKRFLLFVHPLFHLIPFALYLPLYFVIFSRSFVLSIFLWTSECLPILFFSPSLISVSFLSSLSLLYLLLFTSFSFFWVVNFTAHQLLVTIYYAYNKMRTMRELYCDVTITP